MRGMVYIHCDTLQSEWAGRSHAASLTGTGVARIDVHMTPTQPQYSPACGSLWVRRVLTCAGAHQRVWWCSRFAERCDTLAERDPSSASCSHHTVARWWAPAHSSQTALLRYTKAEGVHMGVGASSMSLVY
jgi:hypothetical protein